MKKQVYNGDGLTKDYFSELLLSHDSNSTENRFSFFGVSLVIFIGISLAVSLVVTFFDR